ncbi:DUF427 domain-containing protein [Actinosynnema sp. NPDC047251]|uniref:DUF427 domain-containing protein n=1 Tax=Saccharothrix espanaensis (strain ATCC 51144 / DSM 44229 / JCM 9112 / NBRC 15066 / NRRL 15764) TaxID=1179773 RepID=K0JWB0_SACES|nr:DUF427 domain-containing protein [Saccharothrix espanaensis]CCH29767.1 hypothetical protein BN6_24530 [Saccharothrix espanaensis DSM 44229]
MTAERGRVRVETGTKRVRAYLAGSPVVDTVRPALVWEKPYYPTYYFPAADVLASLVPTGDVVRSPSRGSGEVHDVKIGDVVAAGAALTYPESPLEALRGLVRLEWDAMDEWFEEDEPVYVHPRDPYTRVDALPSSRHVRVEIDGVVVAESRRPVVLFETGLPARYYLPMTDVRMDLLRHTELRTSCPYKGTAEYWSVVVGDEVHENVVWGYRTPLPESRAVAGLVSFYNEKVDIVVDGVREERPRTPFS